LHGARRALVCSLLRSVSAVSRSTRSGYCSSLRARFRRGSRYGGTSWALRRNPSSGNLHPTEGYLVAADLPGLEGGNLSLEPRTRARASGVLAALAWPTADGIIVGIAAIYWREAWKHGIRAFRYCSTTAGARSPP
jgi:hypothetical protein